MSTTTDYVTNLARQSEDANRAVIDAWARTLQMTSMGLPSAANVAAANEIIDQMSDFAVSLINVQRSFAKQITESTAGVAQRLLQQTTEVAGQTRQSFE